MMVDGVVPLIAAKKLRRHFISFNKGQHPAPPPWGVPNIPQPPPDPGLLKQVASQQQQQRQEQGPPTQGPPTAGPFPARYQPYGFPRHHLKFTIHDLDKCLYGKQELRVVQVDPKPQNGKGGSSNSSEDKNKPAKWCDMCQEIRFGECPQHGPLPSLRPTVTLPGPKSYAISTFPDEVGLCTSTLPVAGYGVFARHFIPMGTWIGPYEGKKIPVEEGLKQISQGDAPFLWEIYESYRLSHFLDASDENASSWMRFIQCARHNGEQNLFVFQYYGSIYYRAFKDIPVGTELLVWYDDKYPQYFGMPYDIRDMSSYSMESIQAPMEVTKMPEFEGNRHPPPHREGERPHHPTPYIHNGGKMIPSSTPMPTRERNEPPRIPPNGPSRSQPIPSHASSIFQTPPAQPPTLIQAPSIVDTRSAHSSVYVSATRSQSTHLPVHPGQSPRQQGLINAAYARESAARSPGMPRSASAEELRRRTMLKDGRASVERVGERELIERPSSSHTSHAPPPGLLIPQVNPSQRATLHYSSSVFSSKLPPAVMSVAPLIMDHSKIKIEDVKSEVNMSHEKERLAAIERERIVREPERMALEIERLSAERSRVIHDRSIHDNHITPREPWDTAAALRCKCCGQTFHQKSALEKHKCASEGAKPYQCGKCQLSFQEPRHLQEHMAMHNTDRPYKCGVCSRSFSGATTLTNHMRLHANGLIHEKTSEGSGNGGPPSGTSLECQKCGKRFLQSEDYNKHVSSGSCTS